MIAKIIYILITLLMFSSCLKEEYPDNAFEEQLVVEGSIEQDGVAKVMLSLNMQHSEKISEETLRNRIIRYAIVVVTDETDSENIQSEQLICRMDKKYPTQFVYMGATIIGKVGGKYRLDIYYSGRQWTATTTIPEPNRLYDVTTEIVGNMYRIKATIKPNADNLPYMVRCETSFTKEDEPYYLPPALFGIIENCEQETTITINRPLDYENIREYSTLFLIYEDVYIQFCTMSKFGYRYWSLWENCTLNSLNPVFPVDEEPPTNIVEVTENATTRGAAGIWQGYGVSYYRVVPNLNNLPKN
ncbi:MAG: DUF4249 family protein [Rikenellaceae bacterium]|nr:DUF4249 family protein [Rikenellaceae bacterium]